MAPKLNKLLSLLSKDKAGTYPGRQVVEFYGLNRENFPLQAGSSETKFMEPFTGPSKNAEYSSYRIHIVNGASMLNWYLISVSLHSYITMYVDLTRNETIGSERCSIMKYRDMMVDNYLNAGGDLRTWRYIGVNGITNRVTHHLVTELFQARGGDIRKPFSVEVAPGDKEFADVMVGNPFTRGIQGLLRQYEKEMGHARIKRFVFMTEYVERRLNVNPKCECHLVVELCRPGESGYRRGWLV
ncbi:hypothetical protein NPX13_g4385 [Xylaria arbuscula]|uniref:Uncharacterized protein n=1 Tax=Xylaria arbuscula TaxID=114810 RepID=A0A9W8NG56_9PEZI|nr:hypothetical protein NPX13_g4385 [Xylaria arbuscula]